MQQVDDVKEEPGHAPTEQRGSRVRRELRSFFELLALTTIAVTQPLLDALRKNATDVFVGHRLGPVGVWSIVLIIVLAPTLLLWVIEFGAGLLAPRVRPAAHATLAGVVGGVIVYEVFGGWFDSWPVGALVAVAVALGIGLAVAVARSETLRSYLRILAIGAFIFPLMFVTSDTVSPLAFKTSAIPVADVTVSNPRNIVMIVMDELPTASLLDGHGKIDAGLFPNFAALADDSRWYRNTTSVAPYTFVAVPPILTGLYPTDPKKLPNAQQYPRNLFTLLGGSYTVNDHSIDDVHLCPDNVCGGGIGDVTGALQDSVRLWKKVASASEPRTNPCACDLGVLDEQLPQGERFVRSLQPTRATNHLDFLHVVIPHAPWRYLPTGQFNSNAFAAPKGIDVDTLEWPNPQIAESWQRAHLMQLQAGDRLLGEIIARLKAEGRYDNSVVIVTADHGAAFTAGSSYRTADEKNYHEIMWVPLFVKVPGEAPGVIDDRPARTIDILPTIADIVGVDLPWKVDGVSLRGTARVSATRRFMKWGVTAFLPPKGNDIFTDYDGKEGLRRLLATPGIPRVENDRFRLYGLGSHADLVGKRAASYAANRTGDLTGILTHPELLRGVDPAAQYVPATRIEGGFDGERQINLALAINGTVGAVVPTIPGFTGRPSFSAVVPPQLLRRGSNRLDLYEVRGTEAQPELIPLRLLKGTMRDS